MVVTLVNISGGIGANEPTVTFCFNRACQGLKQIYYEDRLNECKKFWKEKLQGVMEVSLPEKRIANMMKAGFHHLDLLCTGKEPHGPLAPNIGFYCPIGSESSPIIQYFDSIGRTDLARRCLDYFFEKQHDNGFMQNFQGYMLETGAILWTTYLHFLYTGDLEWIQGKQESIALAADYLIKWAENNMKEELKGRGYGMLDGKVADPEDPYHSYMLNAYAYAGLKGAAKILSLLNSQHYERIHSGAESLKNNILAALEKSISDSPAIPLGNGRWCPSVSPWPEYRGPLCLSTDGGNFSTHESVTSRDSLLGAIYLIFLNVIDISSLYSQFIMNSFSELLYQRNTAFSQPYYSQHSFINLRQGDRKSFIKEFYNSVAALADKETYTFWEHFQLVSIHKTHEEAWFLLRCRNMLYTEIINEHEDDRLILMPGVPEAWLMSKEPICIKGANTYFGKLSYEVKHLDSCEGLHIDVDLDLRFENKPTIVLNIPLPKSYFISEVSCGHIKETSNQIIFDRGKTSLSVNVLFSKR